MRYGVSVPNVGDPARLLDLAVTCESAGWDGFFLWDHLQLDATVRPPALDPWVLMGAIAATTSTVRLGALVTPVARRRPWKLAKEITTLDHLSGGRLIVGVGLGVPPDAEYAAFGESPDPRVHAAKLDEGLVARPAEELASPLPPNRRRVVYLILGAVLLIVQAWRMAAIWRTRSPSCCSCVASPTPTRRPPRPPTCCCASSWACCARNCSPPAERGADPSPRP
jgi:hypothetical protein